MAEGYFTAANCTAHCPLCRTWVPFPPAQTKTRRDPLSDAYGRTDNPCERPLRSGFCCEPMPKFRAPRELPACNLDCYREEQRRAKAQEACEQYQKFVKKCCPKCPPPEMVIEPLDPEYPIQVELPDNTPEENKCYLSEVACRTNIIAGFFNPDDNKTAEQRLKEQCDRTHLSCGPNLPMYPCRATIRYPPLRWTSGAEEMNKCNRFVCKGSKYCDPEFQRQQMQEMMAKECEKRHLAEQQALEEEERRYEDNPIHPCCANQKYSLMPDCNCGCDMTRNFTTPLE